MHSRINSNKFNDGLLRKAALIEKLNNITIPLVKKIELLLIGNKFSIFKKDADHFIDGGWSGTSKATFVMLGGWLLELSSGNYVTIQHSKLRFRVKSGEYGGTRYNHPEIIDCPDSLLELIQLDRSLDDLLTGIYVKFPNLQQWFDDLLTTQF